MLSWKVRRGRPVLTLRAALGCELDCDLRDLGSTHQCLERDGAKYRWPTMNGRWEITERGTYRVTARANDDQFWVTEIIVVPYEGGLTVTHISHDPIFTATQFSL